MNQDKFLRNVEENILQKSEIIRKYRFEKQLDINNNEECSLDMEVFDSPKNEKSTIKEKNYNVSIGYVNLRTGYTYKYNEGTVYYGASLAKTVTAMYLTENNLLNALTCSSILLK